MAYWRGNKPVAAALVDAGRKRGFNLESVKNTKVAHWILAHFVTLILFLQNEKLPSELKEEGKVVQDAFSS